MDLFIFVVSIGIIFYFTSFLPKQKQKQQQHLIPKQARQKVQSVRSFIYLQKAQKISSTTAQDIVLSKTPKQCLTQQESSSTSVKR